MATIEHITEYLDIDLDQRVWLCNRCGHEHGPADQNYKRGLLVRERDPREVHRPLLDEDKYEYTFAPDPAWCRILEYFCPGCAAQIEVEYLPPGHPITHDIALGLDWLKQRADARAQEDKS
jgi:acetone carboxylase gamma subunit